MTRINLYPWREELEERQKKQFIILLSFLSVIMFIAMFVINGIYASYVRNQTENNEYLQSELVKLDRQLREINELKAQKDALISRLGVIQKIENDRYDTLTLFNEIINLINPLIVLKEIKRTDSLVKITGVAESNAEVAKFLRALDISPSFRRTELNQIRVEQDQVAATANNNQQVRTLNTEEEHSELTHHFELQFYQIHPQQEDQANLDKVNNQPGAVMQPDIQTKG